MLHVLNNVYSHSEKPGSSIRLMFFDFSSAFNTIQPHLIVQKLLAMNLSPSTVHWIFNYLTNRPQMVSLNGKKSDVAYTNTGAPQGTVLAPFLFTLYTASCRNSDISCPLVKFADDTAMVGKISNDDDSIYLDEIERFTDWCNDNYLNVLKTKELCIDFRKVQCDPAPVHIKDSIVDRVNEYKYLGIKLDSKLKWVENTNFIIKKANTRLYCLRKLRSFGVSHDLLGVFFNAVVCSALTFGIVCWGGNLSRHEMGRLNKIIKKGSQIIGKQRENIDSIYNKRIMSKAHSVLKDQSSVQVCVSHYFVLLL